MRLAIHGEEVLIRAPAKVNLFLEVLAKRPDGYHEIATLMVAINLMDTLVFKEEPDLRLACDRPNLSVGPDNLILKAARLLQQRTGCGKGAFIRLTKRIPMAAGLGGGSTDAAAALVGLNRLWRLDLPASELENMGAALGSDVPFFFHTPAAWCTGRGELVSPLSMGRRLDFVLICPPFGCPTAAVYGKVKVPNCPENGAAIRQALAGGYSVEVGRHLHNRLQEAAEKVAPTLTAYRGRLADLGPAGQLMSGSGSSLFALCRDRAEAERLARELRNGAEQESFTVFLVRSCS